MVIAQSFLARTFGSYTLQLFDVGDHSVLVPVLGVALLLVAFLINLSGNRLIEGTASFIGILKIGGIIVFGLVGVWIADSLAVDFTRTDPQPTVTGFLGATALGILAFKGFTTITNSGSEVNDPHRNVGRAIIISIALCVVIYTLVYTVVLGLILTAFFDLSRIAALGIIFYLIMDIAVHWGVLRYLRQAVGANPIILVIAIVLDLIVLGGFIWVKLMSDPVVIGVAALAMALILLAESIFLANRQTSSDDFDHDHHR
jgi:amino acid transporter